MKAFEDLVTHYDLSVRNSEGAMLQFCYGADGLDPMTIEGDGIPVEFARNLRHVKEITPPKQDRGLLPWEINFFAEKETQREIWQKNCMPTFIEMVLNFVNEKMAGKLAKIRRAHGLQSVCRNILKQRSNLVLLWVPLVLSLLVNPVLK